MSQIKFGTDGWRAVIAEDFTFENVARVSQATADYWRANPVIGTDKKIIIGYDRRFFSDRFAQTAAEVFAGNGFHVVLTPEPTPTPSVSFAVKQLRAVGGVMITASHNPPSSTATNSSRTTAGRPSRQPAQRLNRFSTR